jgi:hypothetical protein
MIDRFPVAPTRPRLALWLSLAVATLVASGTATPAVGAVTLQGDEVVVQAHEVIEDDLVIQASYARVDGIVKGDLTIVASDVAVEGIVEQDLLVVAKTLYLNGAVNDDARFVVFAAALGDQARVADDAWSLAYSLETREDSRIGGTLHAAGRQVLLAGQVVEDLRVRSGALELRGLTGGSVHAVVGALERIPQATLVVDVDLEIPDVQDGVRVTDTAAIGGDLDYRALDPADIWPQARIAGEVRYEPWSGATSTGSTPPEPPDDLFGAPSSAWDEAVERLVVLLLLGIAIALGAPRFLAQRARDLRQRPVDGVGWGIGALVFAFLTSVVFGIAFFLLMVVGIGSDLGGLAVTAIVAGAMTQGAIFALSFLCFVYLAPVFASAGIGAALLGRVRPEWTEGEARPLRIAGLLAVGALAYALLRAVPYAGAIVGLLAALAGAGTLARWLRDRLLDEAPVA